MSLIDWLRALFAGGGGDEHPGDPGDPRIVHDARAAAEWAAKSLSAEGYRLDFRIKSLDEIDRLIAEHSEEGQPLPGGLLDGALGTRLFALGGYVGEVLRRNTGGRWVGDDDDPEGELNVAVLFSADVSVQPIRLVAECFRDPFDDGIYSRASRLVLRHSLHLVEPPPDSAAALWLQAPTAGPDTPFAEPAIAAAWVAEALTRSGYVADFSIASLKEVDRFFDEQARDGRARVTGLLAERLAQRLFAIGAYLGEVIRRRKGGHWEEGEGGLDPRTIQLRLAEDHISFPMAKVARRYRNGEEDSLYLYGQFAVGGPMSWD